MPRRIWIALTVLLVAALVGAAFLLPDLKAENPSARYFGKPEHESVDIDKPINEQTRTVKISDRTFKIPKIYIGSALDPGLVQKDGLILEYVLPDYKSKLDFPNKDAYKQAFKAGSFGQMLIEPEAPRPSFDVMIENLRRDLTKEEYIGVHDGLEYFKWYRGKPEAPSYYYDIYLEKDGAGKILSFIECAPIERPVLVPHCFHKFRDKALLYSVTYNKKNFFATWKDQRRRATEFVDSFEIKKTINSIKKDRP